MHAHIAQWSISKVQTNQRTRNCSTHRAETFQFHKSIFTILPD